ncbi:MAG: hypothetical protein IKZ99_04625 [Salinivirgaceae bacterium]|nr:hypothetical protein [Salinivirgaceae bacterium]
MKKTIYLFSVSFIVFLFQSCILFPDYDSIDEFIGVSYVYINTVEKDTSDMFYFNKPELNNYSKDELNSMISSRWSDMPIDEFIKHNNSGLDPLDSIYIKYKDKYDIVLVYGYDK